MPNELNEKLIEIKKILAGLSVYYNQNISVEQLAMYAIDLHDLNLDELAVAIKRVRMNPSIKHMPRPAEIIEQVRGNENHDAITMANKIVEAIGKYGYNNSDKAKSFLGDKGWEIVKRDGGWASICERATIENISIMKAQWRELAKAVQYQNVKNDLQSTNALEFKATKFLLEKTIKSIPE